MRRKYTKHDLNQAFIFGVALGSLLMSLAFLIRELL